MLKRARKPKSFLRITLYIFFSSLLFLLILSLIFYNGSWFKRPIVINPVVRNSDVDSSKIGRLLSNASISFSSISFTGGYFDIELVDGGRVYISSRKDPSIQVSSLQAILKQLTINGKKFQIIDFRFDKPVIKL